MHPIFRREQFVAWAQSRPWRPNLVLLVIYAVLFCLVVTQLETVHCKCNFHPVFREEEFHQNYAVFLLLLFCGHFFVSNRLTTRLRQVVGVCIFTVFAVISVPLSLDSATHAPSKFGAGNQVGDITF